MKAEQLYLPFPNDEYRPNEVGTYYSKQFRELLQRHTSTVRLEEGNEEARKRLRKLFCKCRTDRIRPMLFQ